MDAISFNFCALGVSFKHFKLQCDWLWSTSLYKANVRAAVFVFLMIWSKTFYGYGCRFYKCNRFWFLVFGVETKEDCILRRLHLFVATTLGKSVCGLRWIKPIFELILLFMDNDHNATKFLEILAPFLSNFLHFF